MLFSTYDSILDIVTQRIGAKKQSMRGQAHIVFRDVQTSTQALRSLQGFELFGKELNIVYGKGTSNIIPKLRGTFEPTTAEAASTQQTDLQKSIFNAPPSGMPAKPIENGLPPAPRAATAPSEDKVMTGVKRPREEEEEDDQSDAPMEEDDDEAEMEEDSD